MSPPTVPRVDAPRPAPGAPARPRAFPAPSLPVPGRLAIAGFGAFALFLAVLAMPAARESVLLSFSSVAFGVGVVCLARAEGPRSARRAAIAVAAYLALLLVLFAASTPVTIGRYRYFLNESPPEWAGALFGLAVQAAPAALLAGVGAAAWAWSGRVGQGAILAGGALLGVFLALLAFAPAGDETTEEAALAVAAVTPRLTLALSLASLAFLAAVGIVLARRPLRLEWG